MKPLVLARRFFSFLVLFLFQHFFSYTTGTTSITLKPNNPFAYIEEELIMNCSLNIVEEYNSSQLQFSRGADQIINETYVTIINDKMAQLIIRIEEDNLSMYMCRIRGDNDFNVYPGVQSLTREYKPRPPENVTCIVGNWETMTCTWDLGRYINMKKISVSMRWMAGGSGGPCPAELINKSSCVWSKDDYNGLRRYELNIIVTHIRQDGLSVSQGYPLVAKVKPAPVSHLKAMKVESRSVQLSWNHYVFRTDGTPFRNLTFSIIYQSKWDSQPVNVSHPMERKNYTLFGLHPDTEYIFRMAVIPDEGGYWSVEAETTITTPEDVPNYGPEAINGSFYQENCKDGKRFVRIYFKHVPESDQNGLLRKYSAAFRKLRPDSDNEPIVINVAATKYSIQSGSDLDCNADYEVLLSCFNAAGESKNNTWLFIPKMSLEDQNLKLMVMILGDGNKPKSVVANWKESVRQPSSYTLYWCQSSTIATCEDDINWTRVRNDIVTSNLPDVSPDDVLASKYIFAISSTYGSISRPMVFAECIYKSWKSPVNAPEGLMVSSGELALIVNWTPKQCDQQSLVHIETYNVNYCPADHHGNCAGEALVKPVNSIQSSYQVDNLKADINYRISIQPVSQGGKGPKSNPLYGVPYKSYRLNSGEITGIALAGLTVLIFAALGLVYCYRKCNLCKSFDIKVPILVENDNNIFDISKPPPVTIRQIDCGRPSSNSEEQLVNCTRSTILAEQTVSSPRTTSSDEQGVSRPRSSSDSDQKKYFRMQKLLDKDYSIVVGDSGSSNEQIVGFVLVDQPSLNLPTGPHDIRSPTAIPSKSDLAVVMNSIQNDSESHHLGHLLESESDMSKDANSPEGAGGNAVTPADMVVALEDFTQPQSSDRLTDDESCSHGNNGSQPSAPEEVQGDTANGMADTNNHNINHGCTLHPGYV